MEYYHEKVETDFGIPARIHFGGSGRDKLRYPLHWHRNLEFDLVLEGCIRGKIGQQEICVHEGEIFFVNSGELHETDASGQGHVRTVTLLLSDKLLREYCPELDSYYFEFQQGSVSQKKLADCILKCGEIYRKKEPYYALDLAILLRRLCKILLTECMKKKVIPVTSGSRHKSTKRIKETITYIEQHYENNLTIDEMGNVLGMTPPYFSRFFKKSTGETFHGFLTRVRLCHARQALEEGEENVTVVALSCGFPNVKAFIEAFKREYSTTPARYRMDLGKIEKR